MFDIISVRHILILLFPLFLFSCSKSADDTDTFAPTLMESTPANGATSVNINTSISLKFTEQIVLSASGKIRLNDQVVNATVSPRTLTIISSGLQYNTTYTLIIPNNAVSDVAGNFAREISITFTTKELFSISSTLVTPSPSVQAVKLYDFLRQNFGMKVISGTMANHSTNITEATWVHTQTGKWPALTAFDFIDHTNPNQNWIQYAAPFTLGQDWWNNKGIVSLVWHWRDPLTKSGAFYTTDTSFDVSKVNDPNSDEYKAMIVDIDVIAGYLKQFKDAGIPVIWRPLHEAAGGWFWWGAKGPEACKTLWKLMFNRLVTVHGLNNLIWVWTSDTESSALSWYPGDEYVDIIGMDIYPGNNNHASQSDKFNKVNEIFSNKKIIALTECGSVPDPALMKSNGDVWSWFMPWNGDFTESDIHNGATWWNKFFSYDFVITRDQMPDLKN
ncbi:MAG TPA: glycosyl hydrolase [Prolixibacteraceae bacterium]|nr:glycosyl hydrolase [Prolixibacteraceae bacterium]